MDMKIDVSVIITVYNYICNELIETVFMGWKRQNIELEIILCEQSMSIDRRFLELCMKYGVRYVHCLPDIIGGKTAYNIGRVRNIAALTSRGEYLYFSDADVLVTNPNYLKNLMFFSKSHYDTPLVRPFARRLAEEDCKEFCNAYCDNMGVVLNENDYFCNAIFDMKLCMIKGLDGGERYKLINNILHVCKMDQYEMEVNMIKFNPNIMEEFSGYWKTAMHYGGLFCSFKNFINVRGYCEQYYNWGWEDTDIQWKLNEFTGIQIVDNSIKKCSLIHFEHKVRCQNEQYKMNTNIFNARKSIGPYKAREEDENNEESFIGAWINDDIEKMHQYIDQEYGLQDLRRM